MSFPHDAAYRRRRSNPGLSRCRSETCRRPIVWVRTAAGKKMPLDAVPVDDGPWQILDGQAVRVVGQVGVDVDRFTAHWATCPDAADFRSRPSFGDTS